MEIIQNLCPKSKYEIKCPNAMTPTRIVIHNTANDASAANEISYMLSNDKETSFHFAVDDVQAIQGIPLDRNAWHAGDGNGKGNREGIAIEICYSKSGGERWLKAVDNAAQLTADLLKQYGWGVDKVTKHADYANKHCPHRILDEYGWNNFILLVDNYLVGDTQAEAAPTVTYAIHTSGGAWLSDVTGYNEQNADGYAGITGKAADGIRAILSRGNIRYRVHTVGGSYLDWVVDHDAAQGGYAGLYGKAIDGVQMELQNLSGYAVEYRVSTIGGGYLPWVRNYNDTADGYAGIYGKSIDRVQIRIVKL
jgi:hypothetical protein